MAVIISPFVFWALIQVFNDSTCSSQSFVADGCGQRITCGADSFEDLQRGHESSVRKPQRFIIFPTPQWPVECLEMKWRLYSEDSFIAVPMPSSQCALLCLGRVGLRTALSNSLVTGLHE